MAVTFTTNDEAAAIGQAVEQSRGNRWRGVFRDPHTCMLYVHDMFPCSRQVVFVTAAINGRLPDRGKPR